MRLETETRHVFARTARSWSSARAGAWVPPLVAGLVALAARLATWSSVFTSDGVRFLVDSDTHYHVLRAQRILQGLSPTLRFDPFLNFPHGAEALWPPLFDYAIAVPARILGGSVQTTEMVAAFVPVAFGVATVVLVVLMGRSFFGARAGLAAGIILALLSAHVAYTVVGRPDQHAAETFLSTALFGAYMLGLRARASRNRWTAVVLLGALISLSFWNWMGSAVYLLVLASFAAIWDVVGPTDESRVAVRLLAVGSGVGAVLLGLSLAVLEPGALRHMSAKGVTGFHVLLVAAVAVFAAVLWWLRRLGSGGHARRALDVLIAAGFPLLCLASLPSFREAAGIDLAALFSSNRWYGHISEFQPLAGAQRGGLWANVTFMTGWLGLTLIVLPAAVPVLIGVMRARKSDAATIAFLVHWTLLFVLATFFRVRFQLYAAVPLALTFGVVFDDLSRRLETFAQSPVVRFAGFVPILGALVLVAPCDRPGTNGTLPFGMREIEPALRWLRAERAPPGHEAVLADWSLGHLVQYYGAKPVIVSPFGSDGGAGAMEAAAAFYLASDEVAAERALAERRVGYVLLNDPYGNAWVSAEFSRSPPPELLRLAWPDGSAMPESFGTWPMTRLYFFDGGSPGQRLPAMSTFRLLFDTPPTKSGIAPTGMFKLFGFVPGAIVAIEGAPPGSQALAEVSVLTNTGRAFVWRTWAVADGRGTVELRVPYVTGENGLVRAGPCVVRIASRAAVVTVTEDQVRTGQRVSAALPRR
jgi:dolichyl-diphosphooligosaccharide--protein glycosyltransferase